MRYEEITHIDAPVELMWRLTSEVEQWPTFLPTVQRLERLDAGELRIGSTARIKQPAQSTALWTVTQLEPGRGFTWETRRRGLRMAGVHHLEPSGTGTRMTLAVETDGPLAGVSSVLFGGLIRSSLRQEAAGFTRQAATVA